MNRKTPARVGLVVVTAAIAGTLAYQSASSSAPSFSEGVTAQEDGGLPKTATVFDDYPGVANLEPDLLGALRRAAADARAEGVEFRVNSGWRSPAYQDRLLSEAVAQYGSAEAAARWVATPEKSAHVLGKAVDLGPAPATTWLSEHGSAYGLCQIYRNEPWHYELRPEAIENGCPAMYADPTHDPRMH
ncbi:MAG: M15 family metallopeptidase [Hamadaea sp.]|uniref:M15 family metallopeptidase n=1 Tax=Hamadaea sp. TaxID=2024425 RepID=UPI00184EA066|nr:M15 family metallopeptidase [Hamadaea sp.]NUT18026.1 M15 family metallopeptidase [Hamadaea sp.]